jgi:hypothetical protein
LDARRTDRAVCAENSAFKLDGFEIAAPCELGEHRSHNRRTRSKGTRDFFAARAAPLDHKLQYPLQHSRTQT